MDIRKCTAADVPLLATLNKQLIEDEQSSNPMNMEQLEERMRGFLEGSYEAFFFTEGGTVIGYALVDKGREPLYLRQFLIDRASRREHCGTGAFRLLMEELGAETIDIEVLPWNERGMRFWKSLGFEEKSVAMQLRVKSEEEV